MTFRTYEPQDVFDYIVRYKMDNDGNSPTVRQIKDEFGMGSTATVEHIVKGLVKAGKIGKKNGKIVLNGTWILKDDISS